MKEILDAYQIDIAEAQLRPYGTGLINHTWLLTLGGKEFILQKINKAVFKDPLKIDHNIRLISSAFKTRYPQGLFVSPLSNSCGETMTCINDEYYRLFPFVKGSHSVDFVQSAAQAYEAAAQFAKFTSQLTHVDLNSLSETIPGFHNLEKRYEEFVAAVANGNQRRLANCRQLVDRLLELDPIVKTYASLVQNDQFKRRVMHHDTKISNVLFDASDKGLCVIDLDTVMPGYIISDVGDMMRTYLSPASEEATNLSLIKVRVEIYRAIVDGYLSEMGDELTASEKSAFFYAGRFMIYMQALRFATDYLFDDIYYSTKYPGHNLSRALNQLALLEDLQRKENILAGYPFAK